MDTAGVPQTGDAANRTPDLQEGHYGGLRRKVGPASRRDLGLGDQFLVQLVGGPLQNTQFCG